MISKHINFKKKLYFSLFAVLSVLLIISCSIIVFSQVKERNTWQYNAEYDFEQIIEVGENGGKIAVLNIQTPNQLAGAFNTLAAIARPDISIKDGNGGSKPVTGSKTETSINSAIDNLNGFDKDSTTIRLTQNIAFNSSKYTWTPVDFAGKFEGEGYIISGLVISSNKTNIGFFAKNSGTVENVVFENVSVTRTNTDGSAHNTGIVAGINSGTIQNVNVIGSSSITGSLNTASAINNDREVGGIAGTNSGTIKYCMNYANITNGKHVGGIAGKSSGTVEYCNNYGTIKSAETTNKTKYARVGGIIGEATDGTVRLCVNEGSVEGRSSDSSGNTIAGGIVGCSTVAITECANFGSVKAGSTSTPITYVGGIVGNTTKKVEDCFNKGSVTGDVKTTEWGSKEFNPFGGRITYAEHVGELWLWDNHVVSGEFTDDKGSGDFAKKTYKSKYYYKGGRSYNGGIAGYSTSLISRCYNLGTVSSASSKYSKVYQVYVKQDAQCGGHNYNLLVSTTITYGAGCYAGNIAGYISGNVTSGYYTSSTKISANYTFSAAQKFSTTGGGTQSNMSLSSWTKNSENSTWFATDVPGYYFNTYYNIDASSVSKIYLKVHYKKNIEKDEKTYYTIDTGLSSSTLNYSEKGTQGNITLNNLNGSNKWETDSTVNGGYPYLKGMYW